MLQDIFNDLFIVRNKSMSLNIGYASKEEVIDKARAKVAEYLQASMWLAPAGRDLRIVEKPGKPGAIIAENVTPAEAWKKVKEWAESKGIKINTSH